MITKEQAARYNELSEIIWDEFYCRGVDFEENPNYQEYKELEDLIAKLRNQDAESNRCTQGTQGV